jgi:hypothetical protein
MNDSYGLFFQRVLYPSWESGIRHRPTLGYLKRLERTQWCSLDELQAIQEAELNRLLSHAFRNVPHYALKSDSCMREIWVCSCSVTHLARASNGACSPVGAVFDGVGSAAAASAQRTPHTESTNALRKAKSRIEFQLSMVAGRLSVVLDGPPNSRGSAKRLRDGRLAFS